MKEPSLSASFLALLFFVSPIPVFSQSQLPDAHVSGMLTDPSGAGIGTVQVTAQLEDATSAQLWSATSAADGAYHLSLPPGRYVIHFSRDPFASRVFTWALAPGESRTVDLRLVLERLSSSVVVTAEAEPVLRPQSTAPTDIITRQVIDQRQAVSIPDLLQFSPGVAFARTGANGGTASLFLDGGNSAFTKVLVDGAPINPPGGAVDFSLLTLDNVDKVEIVRGAESALYGTDAVSGVVQLFSHRGTTRIPTVTLFGEGGSYANGRGGGQISGLLGAFDYSGAASYLRTDGQGPNDGFLNRAVTGNFGYAFSDTNHLRLTLRNNTSDAGIPGQTAFEPPSLHQQYGQKLFSASALWDFVSGDHWHYQIAGAESYTHQHSFNPEQSFYIGGPNSFCPQTNPDAVATTQFCDYTYDDIYAYNRAGFSAQTTYIPGISRSPLVTNMKSKTAPSPISRKPTSAATIKAAFSTSAISPIRVSLSTSASGRKTTATLALVSCPALELPWRFAMAGAFGAAHATAHFTGRASRSRDSISSIAINSAILGIHRSSPRPAEIGAPASSRNS